MPTMLTADPPQHTRYRRLVSSAFTPRAVADLEPAIRAITTRLLDAWPERGRVEAVQDFAVPLPVEVIARALNVPDDRLADFKRWSDDSVAGIGTNLGIEERLAAERGVNEFQHYFADALEQRRTNPQDDLLTRLLQARIDDHDAEVTDKRPLDLSRDAVDHPAAPRRRERDHDQAAHEMLRLLAEHPEQWEAVRRDPSRIPASWRSRCAC